MHDILQGVRPITTVMARSCRLTAERVRSAIVLPARATPARHASGGLCAPGKKSKTKEKVRRGAPRVHLACLIVFDKAWQNRRNGTVLSEASHRARTLVPERYGITGTARKTRADGFDLNVLKLISQLYQTEG